MKSKEINEILDLLNRSHSEFQNIDLIKKELIKHGFIEFKEDDKFIFDKNLKALVTRNNSSLIAFSLPDINFDENDYFGDRFALTKGKIDKDDKCILPFKIVACHADSPALKIKENPTLNIEGYNCLKVEKYGGMIDSCWLDKPLSIAGRLVVNKSNKIYTKLVDIDKDLCIIPNLAIHLNREINDGFKYNAEETLLPIIGMSKKEDLFINLINKYKEDDEEILGYDLYLYNREKASLIGANDEFICAPKLDDMLSVYAGLNGFLNSNSKLTINVFAVFNNEEVGSNSINGADSNFLDSVLRRIAFSFDIDESAYYSLLDNSILISLDNVHAFHPLYPSKYESKNKVIINEGIALKHNSNMFYTTDAISGAIVKKIAKDNNIKLQNFYNRSDVRGGSTLGNISNSHVSLISADIGIGQLAMHSNYELAGVKDTLDMIRFISSFYSEDIIKEGNTLSISKE